MQKLRYSHLPTKTRLSRDLGAVSILSIALVVGNAWVCVFLGTPTAPALGPLIDPRDDLPLNRPGIEIPWLRGSEVTAMNWVGSTCSTSRRVWVAWQTGSGERHACRIDEYGWPWPIMSTISDCSAANLPSYMDRGIPISVFGTNVHLPLRPHVLSFLTLWAILVVLLIVARRLLSVIAHCARAGHKQCDRCGYPTEPSFKCCPECGRPLASDSATRMCDGEIETVEPT